jgi:hypothetical protein
MCRKAKKQMASSHKKHIYYKKLKDVKTRVLVMPTQLLMKKTSQQSSYSNV